MTERIDPPLTARPAPASIVTLSLRTPQFWLLVAFILMIAAASQLVGPVVIPLGIAAITVLPMVWGLLAGGLVSGQTWKRFPIPLQKAATAVMGVAVILLCARLAFTVGPNVTLLVEAGPALLLQELGHLFGTILLALPIAVLLRMGPATVGATFSIDRESSFAMVSNRYGTGSPQYQGVLSMYVFGTLFGALLISLIASLSTSLGFFDPLALAMGAGVGSGSMMAAAAATVANAHPEMADQILAVAGTSNIITSIVGIYVSNYVALPVAERFYRFLTRRRQTPAAVRVGSVDGPTAAIPASEDETAAGVVDDVDAGEARDVKVPLWTSLPILLAIGVVVSSIAAQQFSWAIVGGYLVLGALLVAGLAVTRLTRGKVAPIISVITIGALVSLPVSPIAPALLAVVNTVDFLSICTVALTVAGLSLGKDLPILRRIGWKIIPVGFVAIAASYLLSVVVAEFALGFWS